MQQLLNSNQRFTALVSFNDVAAMGAMRALQDAGLRVPIDVSVIGFDDIRAAAFISPSLTTVRQPLREMGWMASEYLLARLQGVGEIPRGDRDLSGPHRARIDGSRLACGIRCRLASQSQKGSEDQKCPAQESDRRPCPGLNVA